MSIYRRLEVLANSGNITPLFYLKTHLAQDTIPSGWRTEQHEVSKQKNCTQSGSCPVPVQPKDEQGTTGNDSVMKRGFNCKIILFVTIRGNSFTLSSPYLSFSPFIAGLGWPCKFGREDCLGFSLSV